ncbi:MAG: ABC transporter substrate-binding protein [Alphaproteobacteria bacterium]|nr:ABC transporter substrate-binding protein [Alphaproteobacteria bacterium]
MKLLRLAVAAVALLALDAAAAEAQQLQKISVGLLRLSSSGAVFIAREKGYFREQGLDADLKIMTAAQQVPVAVTSGDADFGVTGLTAGFFNLAGRGALKIVGAQSREEKGYQLNAYMVTNKAAEGGFNSLKDFAGKRLAVTTTGSTFHYSIGILAAKYGFDVKSVTLVPLQSLPNMAAAFKGGQVDATIAPVTVARQLEAEGAGRIIGWVGDETPWQLGALFTSPKAIAERRSTVEKFVRAYAKGAHDYHVAFNARDMTKPAGAQEVRGPGYDEAIGILAKALEQPAERVRVGLPYVDAEARLNVGDVYNQVAFWQSQALVDRTVDARAILDLSFVKGHFNVPR